MATITSALPLPTGRNRLADPRLSATVLSTNGATVTDTRPSSGASDGGSFFRRVMGTANTSSPMSMPLSGAGTSGIPVIAGIPMTVTWEARKSPTGGPASRVDWTWYNAAGTVLSSSTGAAKSVTSSWQRFTQTDTPPANAAYGQPRLIWTGTALVGQTLELGLAQVEVGSASTPWTDNRTLYPVLVLNYAVRRASRNVVQDTLGSKYPTAFLREAQSKSGTLSLLFGSDVSSREAEEYLASANRFLFSEPTVGEEWEFIVTGAVTRTRQTGTSYWIVDAEVREVEP